MALRSDCPISVPLTAVGSGTPPVYSRVAVRPGECLTGCGLFLSSRSGFESLRARSDLDKQLAAQSPAER